MDDHTEDPMTKEVVGSRRFKRDVKRAIKEYNDNDKAYEILMEIAFEEFYKHNPTAYYCTDLGNHIKDILKEFRENKKGMINEQK